MARNPNMPPMRLYQSLRIRRRWIEAVVVLVTAILISLGWIGFNRGDGDFNFVKPETNPEALRTATNYHTMMHLLRHPKARCPAFQILSPRKSSEVDIVIGILTARKGKENFLPQTIKSLIDGMTPCERERSLIVIFIGEAFDLDFVVDTAYELNVLFKSYFGQLIEVISPSKFWYPYWRKLSPSLGDFSKRTKQNLDDLFLMSYAVRKGAYYLKLEDNVLAKSGYMTEITKFRESQATSNPTWFYLNFCNIGSVGELFRTKDLRFFSYYVQVFFAFLPIDWLMELYLANRVCGIDKTSIMKMINVVDAGPTDIYFRELFTEDEENECDLEKGTMRPKYKNSLFQYAGLISSMRGKMQEVKPSVRKDKKIPLIYPHDNPPIKRIVSSIQRHERHSIERAYRSENFF